MKVKRIYRYPTGGIIPDNAVYLNTVKQTEMITELDGKLRTTPCWLVWHYFLVEVEQEQRAECRMKKEKKQ